MALRLYGFYILFNVSRWADSKYFYLNFINVSTGAPFLSKLGRSKSRLQVHFFQIQYLYKNQDKRCSLHLVPNLARGLHHQINWFLPVLYFSRYQIRRWCSRSRWGFNADHPLKLVTDVDWVSKLKSCETRFQRWLERNKSFWDDISGIDTLLLWQKFPAGSLYWHNCSHGLGKKATRISAFETSSGFVQIIYQQ